MYPKSQFRPDGEERKQLPVHNRSFYCSSCIFHQSQLVFATRWCIISSGEDSTQDSPTGEWPWHSILAHRVHVQVKGSYNKKILSPKPHILDSNEVWQSSFWSEGPNNHLKLKILVSKFVHFCGRIHLTRKTFSWMGGYFPSHWMILSTIPSYKTW